MDLSEANKYSPLSTYYFGHQPANRLELSRGRDLEFAGAAGPASGPINFLAYPLLEVQGKPVPLITRFSFHRSTPIPTPIPTAITPRTGGAAAPTAPGS